MIHNEREKTNLIENSSIYQIGGQPFHRPEELVFVLKSLIAKYRLDGKCLILKFYDIKKCFDKERLHDVILTCLKRGANKKAVRLWYLLYKLLLVLFFCISLSYTWYLYAVEYWSTPHWWKYIIYLTHWGIVSFCLSLVLDTTLVLSMYKFRQSSPTPLLLPFFRLRHPTPRLCYHYS